MQARDYIIKGKYKPINSNQYDDEEKKQLNLDRLIAKCLKVDIIKRVKVAEIL